MNTWYQNYKIASPLLDIDNEYPSKDKFSEGLDKLNNSLSQEDTDKINKSNKDQGENFSFLNSGTQGVAYVSGNVVKKYTTHDNEIKQAYSIIEKQNKLGGKLPYIVQVFSVNRINANIVEIVMEKVNPLNEMQSRIFLNFFDKIYYKCRYIDSDKLKLVIKDMTRSMGGNINETRNFVMKIVEFCNILWKSNLADTDIIPSNVGLRGEDIVILDLGSIEFK